MTASTGLAAAHSTAPVREVRELRTYIINTFADIAEVPTNKSITFHSNMRSYHGAQAISGNLQSIADVINRQFMRQYPDGRYPWVVRLERASGVGKNYDGTPAVAFDPLTGVFRQYAVLDPSHELWKYFMDDRLFGEIEWKGITCHSKETAYATPFVLDFPDWVKHIQRVKVVDKTQPLPEPSVSGAGPPVPSMTTGLEEAVSESSAPIEPDDGNEATSSSNEAVLPRALTEEPEVYHTYANGRTLLLTPEFFPSYDGTGSPTAMQAEYFRAGGRAELPAQFEIFEVWEEDQAQRVNP